MGGTSPAGARSERPRQDAQPSGQGAQPSREDEASAGRHVSNAILANVAAELHEMGGHELVARVKQAAGEVRPVEDAASLLGWSSLEQAVALIRAAVTVTGDEDVPFRAGERSFRTVATAEFIDHLRALGGPGELLRLIGPVAAKVTTVTDAEAVEVGDRHAVIRYVTRRPHVRDPLLCRYTMGSLASFGSVFELAPAEVTEVACQTRGDPYCEYRVRWDPSSDGLADPEARIEALQERVEALASRFENLQRVSALLGSTDDVDAALEAAVHLTGIAVTAPRHLLAVRLPGERVPRVHAVGMTPEQARIEAAALLGTAAPADRPATGNRLAVEVVSMRRRYGYLAALTDGEFLPDDDRLLRSYADHAAAALDAAVALGETRLLLDLSAQLAEIAGVAEMNARIAQAALRVVASERAAVLSWEPADGLLVCSAVARWDGTGVVVDTGGRRGAAAAASAELLGRVATGPGRARAAWEDPAFAPVERLAGCRRGIVAPLTARRQLVGLLVLEAGDAPPGIDDDVARRTAAVANLAGSALHSARLLEMVQHQANHDPLTGLPNARLFGDRLTTAIAACRRSGSRLAVLFVDLDGFKDVNDRLGHAAGDRVLCEVGARLRQTVRTADSVGRLGGDEFVVLVPDVRSGRDAEAACERVAAALGAGPVVVAGDAVELRASIGVATFPDDGTSPGDLLHHADMAMYRTKLSRRAARA